MSLVDENRLWYKSTRGIDVRESARQASVCAYAILQNDILNIGNSLKFTTRGGIGTSIEVQSCVGRGSTFSFALPLNPVRVRSGQDHVPPHA